MDGPKPYKFSGFCAMDGPKPYKFIGFGVMDGPKPYKLIGFFPTQSVLLGAWAAPGAAESLPKGGERSPPPFERLSGAPWAATGGWGSKVAVLRGVWEQKEARAL